MALPDEQVSVTVRSSIGDDGPIMVHDGLRQVLVSISKASPLTAIAAPLATMPGFLTNQIARKAKERVATGLVAVTSGEAVPDWMEGQAMERTRALLSRNVGIIGRTDIRFGDGLSAVVIVEQNARIGLLALDRATLDRAARVPDLSRSELGSIEGVVTDATTHYGKPAVRIREVLTRAEVLCILSLSNSEGIGREHNWQEVWTGVRVLAVGKVVYRKDGQIIRVDAVDLKEIKTQPVRYQDIADPNATGGLTPSKYLASIWADEDD